MRLSHLNFQLGVEVLSFIEQKLIGRFASDAGSMSQDVGHLNGGAVSKFLVTEVFSEPGIIADLKVHHRLFNFPHLVLISLGGLGGLAHVVVVQQTADAADAADTADILLREPKTEQAEEFESLSAVSAVSAASAASALSAQ